MLHLYLDGLDFEGYVHSLPVSVRPFLKEVLDWDHGDVDKDLEAIADQMLQWEEKFVTLFELPPQEMEDLKQEMNSTPVLLRYVCTPEFVGEYSSYKYSQLLE